MDKDKIAEALLDTLKSCLDNITMPTGKNLLPTVIFSFSITIISLLTNLFNITSLVDWRGALLATVLLTILCYLERRGDNEISRLYRAAKSSINNITRNRQSSGECEEDVRVSDGSGQNSDKAG